MGGCIAIKLLLKSIINHYYKKLKQRFSNRKDFIKNLFKVNQKKTLGVLKLNQVMPKLLAISKPLKLKCYQVQQLLAIVKLLWICLNRFSHSTFHISLEVLYYIWSLLLKLYFQFKQTGPSCSSSKLVNQPMFNSALVIKMVKKNFGPLIKW